MEDKKEKIFVSYTQNDIAWAEWIAEELKKKRKKVIIQSLDFGPGDNFVSKMDDALRTSSIVIAVLSKDYLSSYHCISELTAAYANKNQKLIPVRISDFQVEGLWASLNYIDLFDKTEDESRKLLERIFTKPKRKAKYFPGKPDDNPSRKNNLEDNAITSHNLPSKNNKFTGREELLKNIRNTFLTNNEISLVQAYAMTGMGGIGKTETVKEYAYQYLKEYQHVWWVNAESGASIESAYRSFAERNKLGSPEDKSETVIMNVRNWMQKNDRWLFIFDNAENEKLLEQYYSSPVSEERHILITSRNRRFLNITPIDISVFTEKEACDFIEKYTNKPADEHFRELARKMGYLPLALNQAGVYMKIHLKSYQEYLDLYNKYNLQLLKKYDDDPEMKTVATTWQISLEKIDNKASKQLLNLCAFFGPDNVFTKWFQQASSVLPEELREAADDELVYIDVIAELTKYSLVSLNDEGALSIHRLVQEVIRDSLKKEQSDWRNICIHILNELSYTDFSTAESRSLFLSLAPHVDSVMQGINDEEATEEVSLLYHFLGWGFVELADYPFALIYFGKALAICEKVLGKEHPNTKTVINNMAITFKGSGKTGTFDAWLDEKKIEMRIR